MEIAAYIWTYNEGDFIAHSIRHLIGQGIAVHVFDNWSTDDTLEIARSFSDAAADHWPAHREECSTLTSRLQYLEDLAFNCGYDWVIHHDADEIRRATTGETLREFIRRADHCGYNAVDHAIEVYMPREGWDGTQDPEKFFDELSVANHLDARSWHIKCWKQTDYKVNLLSSMGHQACFPYRRVFPEKLLLKHYPLRTQAHAARKITERRRSYAADELARGHHVQYQTKWWG